jgi:hypothetical protein
MLNETAIETQRNIKRLVTAMTLARCEMLRDNGRKVTKRLSAKDCLPFARAWDWGDDSAWTDQGVTY